MASNYDLDLISGLRNLALNSQRFVFAPIEVKKDNIVISDILQYLATENVNDYLEVLNGENPYELRSLDKLSTEYTNISNLYRQTLNPQRDSWSIVNIQKVLCPYLLSSFLLMEQKKIKNGVTATKISLYHGTQTANSRSICERNFDWRLQGTSKGHKFGQGISFARRSTYACHYPTSYEDSTRTLILATVFCGKCKIGSALVKVPPEGYDSTVSPNQDVIVKYDDAEYFPKFVIHYS